MLILFLAYFLESRAKSMDDCAQYADAGGRLPTLMFLGLIVFQPDLGTAIACAANRGLHAVRGRACDMRYFGYAFVASLLPLYFLIFHVAYRRDRILAFLNPYADPQGNGLPHHSIADCGRHRRDDRARVDGREAEVVLSSRAAHGFHFCGDCGRVGPGGCAFRGGTVCRSSYGAGSRALMAHRRTCSAAFWRSASPAWWCVQAFINISVVLGLMPTKGIPLPLVSYGGSSLFVTLACIGVLLNITKQAE